MPFVRYVNCPSALLSDVQDQNEMLGGAIENFSKRSRTPCPRDQYPLIHLSTVATEKT